MNPRSAGTDSFEVKVMFAGRSGEQTEYSGNKRAAIRSCRNLVKQGQFGTAGKVTMVAAPGVRARRTLIFQCHMALTKGSKLVLKTDEL